MSDSVLLSEDQDRWSVAIRGRAVTRCVVDYAFSLDVGYPPNEVAIRIEGPFSLEIGGTNYRMSPEATVELCPALGLLHQVADALTAYKDGALEVRFATGDLLAAKPDPNYEAWEINGAGGLRIVSLPGGGLAVWRPTA